MMTPDLTLIRRKGEITCGWCPPATPTTPCGQPATWHVAWWFTPKADFSLVCEAHMAAVQEQMVYVDRHPAAIACDMPGTGWLVADPSRCVIASTEDAKAASSEAMESA